MAVKRILVVDGSSVSRNIITRILKDAIAGVQVTTCDSGNEAFLRLGQQRFDLLTTSLLLPDMDSRDLCRRLRASADHRHVPIVVISSDADSRLLMEAYAAGVTDYFDKSQGYKAFGDFIKPHIQRAHSLVGRVLFVEDSMTAATMTRRLLERHGLQVTHTASGEQALELLQKSRVEGAERYDLVITDFYLQGEMTGGDLLHALRSRQHFSHHDLPVLVITADDNTKTQLSLFHAGANDFVNKPLVEEVFMARVRALLLIRYQFEALRQQAHDMERVATTDSLTGVRNRRYLNDQGPQWLSDPSRQPLWAMIIDIDRFKQINDNLGHIIGDHVLAALGNLLKKQFPQGMVVRFGGEEFALLLPSADRKGVLAKAEGLRQAVERLKPDGVDVTISVGITSAADHPGTDLNALLAQADRALYAAKRSGRNRIHVTLANGSTVSVASTGQIQEHREGVGTLNS